MRRLRADADPDSGVFVLREGESVAADRAFEAWTTADLPSMLRALSIPTNPIDRHFLLMGIVSATYKHRREPKMAATCAEVAELHLSEFPQIAPALRRELGGSLPRVTTFQHYATLLAERGEFDRAVAICDLAIKYELHDGTQSGFRGRIKRIQKAEERWRRQRSSGKSAS